MARKRKSSSRLAPIIGIVVVVIALTGGGLVFFLRMQNQLSRLPTFPTETYLTGENLWSLEDQEFKIEGRVDKVIMPSEDRKTTLVSVQPDGSKRRIPLLISDEAGKKTILPEQDLLFKVQLGSALEVLCSEYVTR